MGASHLFDYKSENVVKDILKTAKADGITIRTGYDTVGQVELCLEIFESLKGSETA